MDRAARNAKLKIHKQHLQQNYVTKYPPNRKVYG